MIFDEWLAELDRIAKDAGCPDYRAGNSEAWKKLYGEMAPHEAWAEEVSAAAQIGDLPEE